MSMAPADAPSGPRAAVDGEPPYFCLCLESELARERLRYATMPESPFRIIANVSEATRKGATHTRDV